MIRKQYVKPDLVIKNVGLIQMIAESDPFGPGPGPGPGFAKRRDSWNDDEEEGEDFDLWDD